MRDLLLDLGDHRVVAAVADRSGVHLLPIGDRPPGLVVRWLDDDPACERLPDRISRLVAAGLAAPARATIEALVDDLVHRVAAVDVDTGPDTLDLTDGHGRAVVEIGGFRRVIVAVPDDLPVVAEEWLRRALEPIAPTDVIRRSIAGLATWVGRRRRCYPAPPNGLTVALDVDGSRFGATVTDIADQVVIANGPVGRWGDPAPTVLRALDALIERGIETSDGRSPTRSDLASVVAEVVVTGSGATGSVVDDFVSAHYPASALRRPGEDPGLAVVHGLAALRELSGFRCRWPTTDLLLDGELLRPVGPWRADEPGHVTPAGSELALADRDPERAMEIPEPLGSFAVLSVADDGRLVIKGSGATLRVEVDWAVPGSRRGPLIDLRDRITTTDDPGRPTTEWS